MSRSVSVSVVKAIFVAATVCLSQTDDDKPSLTIHDVEIAVSSSQREQLDVIEHKSDEELSEVAESLDTFRDRYRSLMLARDLEIIQKILTDQQALEFRNARLAGLRANVAADAEYLKEISTFTVHVLNASSVVVYEGLPRNKDGEITKADPEQELVKFHNSTFFAKPLEVDLATLDTLSEIVSDYRSFRKYGGPRMCGFNPDLCIQYHCEDEMYEIMVCFGCHEALFFTPTHSFFADIERSSGAELSKLFRLKFRHHSRDSFLGPQK